MIFSGRHRLQTEYDKLAYFIWLLGFIATLGVVGGLFLAWRLAQLTILGLGLAG